MTGDDRYSRHRAIAGFSQERLHATRVAVFGAGAIGNEVVKNLCLLGVGLIDIYDFDTVELHNLTRSVLLRETDVGRPKAAAAAARAAELDPNVTVRAVAGDLFDTLGPLALAGYDVAIGALDNFEARIRLNRLCHLTGTPWINTAIDSRHASVEAFPVTTGAACYECGLPESVYAKMAERRSCGGLARVAREQRIVPTTTVTASLAAALGVSRALTLPPLSTRCLMDSESGHASTAVIERRSDCPACSDSPAASIERIPGGAPSGAALARELRQRQPESDLVELAEPVVLAASCANCGPTTATRSLVGRLARKVDERAVFCFGCGTESVRIELADCVDVDALDQALGNHPLPLAFVRAGNHLYDLTPEEPWLNEN
jgi:molybdopterin/thiamine biosynthesis adenylyltransferase